MTTRSGRCIPAGWLPQSRQSLWHVACVATESKRSLIARVRSARACDLTPPTSSADSTQRSQVRGSSSSFALRAARSGSWLAALPCHQVSTDRRLLQRPKGVTRLSTSESRAAVPFSGPSPPCTPTRAIGWRHSTSWDHLIGTHQYRAWQGDPECPGGGLVDDQLELRHLFDGQVAGGRASEYLVDLRCIAL